MVYYILIIKQFFYLSPFPPVGRNGCQPERRLFSLIKIENHLGTIDISHEYFVNIVGHTATECFGVAGMSVSGPAQGIRNVLTRKQDNIDKGVRVRCADGALTIDLHIVVTYGVNIPAIVKSIVNKVRYVVEDSTGLHVSKVNVFVDSMKVQ